MLLEVIPLVIGLLMLGGLAMIAGSMTRDDSRTRARWDSRFDPHAP